MMRARIRRTYQVFLAFAAQRGVPRAPGMTPTEYFHFLEYSLNLDREAIAVFTNVNLRARYSALPILDDSAERVARTWKMFGNANASKT